MGIEDRGVVFGVHDSRGKRTHEEYHKILKAAADTRSRILGVDETMGTFNARTRSQSYGSHGLHPKGDYSSKRSIQPIRMTEHAIPKVAGGRIAHFQSRSHSEKRYVGSLGRNVVGGTTYKNEHPMDYESFSSTGHSHRSVKSVSMNSNYQNS